MTDADPAVVKVVERVAVPEARVPVPIELDPLLKVTVPVAAEGETVAVSVTAAPTAGVEVDAVSVVVVGVVPPLPVAPGACQKLPQPASSQMPATATEINTTLEEDWILIANSFPAAAAALRNDRGRSNQLHAGVS